MTRTKFGVCWSDVFCWSNAVGSEVTCGELMWLFATCDVMWCDVTSCQPSTTLHYKELFQYYSVLQSTTPVLLRTTKYYSSTAPYYKEVLLQNYSVLQSTTPLLQSTTLCYKVLRQYYSVLQSSTVTGYDAPRWNTFLGRSPQRHTTVQLTQSATTYDNYTSYSLRSLGRKPNLAN